LQRFLEAIERFAIPVAIEKGEPEMIDRLFVFGIELDGALERLDGALELSLVVEDRAEEKVGLRDRFDLHRLLEELLRAQELSLPRVDRAEREVGKEGILRNLDGAAQPALGALQILSLVEKHAVEDRGIEMIGLHFQS